MTTSHPTIRAAVNAAASLNSSRHVICRDGNEYVLSTGEDFARALNKYLRSLSAREREIVERHYSMMG